MLHTFPAPILSVTADAVKDIQGGDALSGLWTVFTKCKESLQDGSRLENISWRLWYREMTEAKQRESAALSEKRCDEHLSGPPMSNYFAGRIICDILVPSTKAVGYAPLTPALEITHESWTAEMESVPALRLPPSANMPAIVANYNPYELEADGARSGTTTVTSSPVLSTSAYGRRRTLVSSSGPRVVVLTPTPNMTPHPTPPQTPIMEPKLPESERAESSTRNYLLPSAAINASSLSRSRTRSSVSPPDSRSSSNYSSSGSSDQSTGAPSTTTSYPPSPSPTLTTFQIAPVASFKTPSVSSSSRSPQDTLRASDRRFFLRQSPDANFSPEHDKQATWSEPEQVAKDPEVEHASVRSDASHVSSASRISDASAVVSDVSRSSRPKQKQKGRSHVKRFTGLQRPPLSRHTSLAADIKLAEFSKLKPKQKTEMAPNAAPEQSQEAVKPPAKRPTFNIGSGSSRSESTDAHRDKGKGKGKETPLSRNSAKPAKLLSSKSTSNIQAGPSLNLTAILPSNNRKRLILESTSSEYETESGSWTGSESFSDTDDKEVDTQPKHGTEDHEEDWASDESEAPVPPQTVLPRVETRRQASISREQAERDRRAQEERERDRQLFAKVPQRSYSQNLINQRSKSGLLSQLLKPNPEIFPPGHFFRVQSGLDLAGRPPGGLSMTRIADSHNVSPKRPGLRTSKSAAAVTLAAVNVDGEPSNWVKEHPVDETADDQSRLPKTGTNGSRRPPDVEYDTESADEADDDKNSIQVSESLAHRKLAALVGRMNMKSERVQGERPPSAPGGFVPEASRTTAILPPLLHKATAPIGFPAGHPYNFTPELPTTPKTTRRAMLQTEMSESVRRNLLWERRGANVNTLKRGNSTGNVLNSGMTRIPSMVQLTAKTTNGSSKKVADPDNFEEDGRTHGERAAHKARNRSWGDNDYHRSGW